MSTLQNEPFDAANLTHDAFLGARLHLFQPRNGYRAGIDPVLLAATVPAKSQEIVIDLGCGAGAAMLCLATRVPEIRLIGVERQLGYADLARRNAAENAIPAEVYCADLDALPPELRQIQAHHIIANPPYFDPKARTASRDLGREQGMAEDTPLRAWAEVAATRLRVGGTVTFIYGAERLPDLLSAFDHRFGSIEVLPLAPRVNRPARLVLVRARKNGKAPFRLHSPIIMHIGDKHETDGDSYTPIISEALRLGKALYFPS